MRFLLAAFLFLASCSIAVAQGCGPANPNCIVPTAPVGTSNNQAASTAFVQQNVAGFLPTTQPNQVLGNNGTTAAPAFAINARTQLPNAKFYVNSSSSATATCGAAGASTCSAGNDSNNCLSPGTACLTLQNVINIILTSYDFADTRADVYLAHTSGVTGNTPTNYSVLCSGTVIGSVAIFIHGDSNAGASVTVIQAPNSGTAITAINLCTLSFDYVQFNDSPSTNANALVSVGGTHATSHIDLANYNLGAVASGVALSASESGTISSLGGCAIVGNQVQALQATKGGIIDFTGTTCTVSNNLTFTTFAVIYYPAIVTGVTASTFGSPTGITGTKCQILGVGAIIGNPTDPNQIFPGNTNCVQGEYTGAVGVQLSGGGYNFGSVGQPLLSGGGSGAFDTFGTLGAGGGGTGVTTANANTVFAGPTSGGAAAPSFRALVASDVPAATPCTTTASSLQYDAAGSFGCVAGVTSDGTNLTFSPAANSTPITITGGSITGSSTVKPGISVSGTLNTSGIVKGAAFFSNTTNTASNGASTLMSVELGGGEQFSVGIGQTVPQIGVFNAGATGLFMGVFNTPTQNRTGVFMDSSDDISIRSGNADKLALNAGAGFWNVAVPLVSEGTKPTLTGTCTTGSQVGGAFAGSFTATCTAQTVIMTFPGTGAPNGWTCIANDITTTTDSLKQSATSTTSCTLTGTTATTDTITFMAIGY